MEGISSDVHRQSSVGVQNDASGAIAPWSLTNPTQGNRWRGRADGHRVVAFPIWLYCDDMSGNLSKKWNKHNSFLFTPAGLPRCVVHHEYNIHFLVTSNLAPPLEMLDGIVEQLRCVLEQPGLRLPADNSLRDCQRDGIWAWDCELKEMVLVVPSVLAMLGDNPMQSEIACHVGMAAKFFCRVCQASRATSDDPDEQAFLNAADNASLGAQSDCSERPSDTEWDGNLSPPPITSSESTRKKKAPETMMEMIERIQRFMSVRFCRPGLQDVVYADTVFMVRSVSYDLVTQHCRCCSLTSWRPSVLGDKQVSSGLAPRQVLRTSTKGISFPSSSASPQSEGNGEPRNCLLWLSLLKPSPMRTSLR